MSLDAAHADLPLVAILHGLTPDRPASGWAPLYKPGQNIDIIAATTRRFASAWHSRHAAAGAP